MKTHARTSRRMLLALPIAAIAAAFLVTPSLAATPASTAAPSPTVAPAPAPASAQGIIMRDGGICDPIRHMGC